MKNCKCLHLSFITSSSNLVLKIKNLDGSSGIMISFLYVLASQSRSHSNSLKRLLTNDRLFLNLVDMLVFYCNDEQTIYLYYNFIIRIFFLICSMYNWVLNCNFQNDGRSICRHFKFNLEIFPCFIKCCWLAKDRFP